MANSRIHKVRGRIITLNSSITTKKGAKANGLPVGKRWEPQDLIFNAKEDNNGLKNRGKAAINTNIGLKVPPIIKGINPPKLSKNNGRKIIGILIFNIKKPNNNRAHKWE